MRELLIVLLQRAEDWVHGAGTSLVHRGQWLPTTSFASGLRPEQRALLGAAAEVYDLVGAAPEGRAVMHELGLDPDAAGLPSMERLRECAQHVVAHRVVGAAAAAGVGAAAVVEG